MSYFKFEFFEGVKVIGWGKQFNKANSTSKNYLFAINSWSTNWAIDGIFTNKLPSLCK